MVLPATSDMPCFASEGIDPLEHYCSTARCCLLRFLHYTEIGVSSPQQQPLVMPFVAHMGHGRNGTALTGMAAERVEHHHCGEHCEAAMAAMAKAVAKRTTANKGQDGRLLCGASMFVVVCICWYVYI